jgi:hypothetical protein
MDARNLTIAVLTVTAAVLTVGLLLVQMLGPQQALAYGQMDRAGDYVVATGQLQNNTEVVYITDGGLGRLNVYLFNRNTRQIDLLDRFDLTAQFQRPARPAQR